MIFPGVMFEHCFITAIKDGLGVGPGVGVGVGVGGLGTQSRVECVLSRGR